MKEEWNNLHYTLKYARKNRDIIDVSAKMDIPPKVLLEIEEGHYPVSKKELIKFSKIYNKTLEDFLLPKTIESTVILSGKEVKINIVK